MYSLNPHDGPKIRKLARAATPGPWDVDTEFAAIWTLGETVAGGTIATVNIDQQTGDHHPQGDAALIAFFDPQVAEAVAVMLDRLAEIIELCAHTDETQSVADVTRAVSNVAHGLNADGTPTTTVLPIQDAHRTAQPLPDLSEILHAPGEEPEKQPHHAYTTTHFTSPDDPTPWVKIVCPECHTEWGWMVATKDSGATARLDAIAEQHNAEAAL